MVTHDSGSAACPCGAASVAVHGKPLFRAYCHCTICQRFNDAPFADIVVFRARDVTLPADGLVSFETLRPPPAVQRGRCVSCRAPVVEEFRMFPIPALVMIPASCFGDASSLPEPSAHWFYEHRQADATDSLPTHQGYLGSQIAFLRALLKAR